MQGIFRIQQAALDQNYLTDWAKELELTDLLMRAREEAGLTSRLAIPMNFSWSSAVDLIRPDDLGDKERSGAFKEIFFFGWLADAEVLFRVFEMAAVERAFQPHFANADAELIFVRRRRRAGNDLDGQRILVNMLLDTTESPINVVLNWTAELKK